VRAYKKFGGTKSTDPPVTLAFCWSHVRRGFYDLAKSKAPIATEALKRIAALYEIEARIRGKSAADRLVVRQAESKPLLTQLRTWFEAQLAKLPARGPLAEAIRYALNHWAGPERFLEDGRIELGGVDDRRGGCSLPAGCWWRFRPTPSARADVAPFPVAAHRTGRAELPHPAPSRPIRPSLSAGRRDVAARRRGRVSCKDTRPGSGRTRCLSVPIVASTSGGPAVRYRLG